jgi:hypothetical protein
MHIQNLFEQKKKKTTYWAELARPIRRLLPGGSESLPQRAGHSSPRFRSTEKTHKEILVGGMRCGRGEEN